MFLPFFRGVRVGEREVERHAELADTVVPPGPDAPGARQGRESRPGEAL